MGRRIFLYRAGVPQPVRLDRPAIPYFPDAFRGGPRKDLHWEQRELLREGGHLQRPDVRRTDADDRGPGRYRPQRGLRGESGDCHRRRRERGQRRPLYGLGRAPQGLREQAEEIKKVCTAQGCRSIREARDAAERIADLPPRLEEIKPVRICRRAWIGQNAFILKGVTIGEGAVVGVNSVVVSDIPPYAVAMGNPARVVVKAQPRTVDAGR